MALLSSLLGWILLFVATFIAMGDPIPGAGYEAALALKQQLTWAAMILSLLCVGFGFARGVRHRAEQKVASTLAILLSTAWVGLVTAMVVTEVTQ